MSDGQMWDGQWPPAFSPAAPAAREERLREERDALRTMLERLLDVALVDGYGEQVVNEAIVLLGSTHEVGGVDL